MPPGVTRFGSVAFGAGPARRFRGDVADPASAAEMQMLRDCSIAPVHMEYW